MTKRRRSMTERERALHALAGRYFPRVGDASEIHLGRAPEMLAPVMVTGLSADGMMVTVRILSREAVRMFGAVRVLSRFGDDGAGFYGSARQEQPDVLYYYIQFRPQPR